MENPSKPWKIVNFFGYNSNNIQGIYTDLCSFVGADNVFCPLSKERIFNKKKQKHKYVDVPSFGGYIFIKTNDIKKIDKYLSSRYSRYYFVTTTSYSMKYASVDDNEIDNMRKLDTSAVHTTFYVGEKVVIIAGAFSNFIGEIIEVKDLRTKVKISVFGKETIVELDCDQIRTP
jgi:transcription antitermination factor NusG